jgi:hypothetical protein
VGEEPGAALAAGTGASLLTAVCVAGIEEMLDTDPDVNSIETTETHTGCPGPRADMRVILIGRVPATGVEAMSTCTRKLPEALMRRVMNWKGTDVLPTDPARATYEASGTVNSNESMLLL